MQVEEVRGIVRFMRLAGALKRTKRTGWIDRGLSPAQVESVADHSFQVALLAWLAAAGEPGLNRDRVLVLALIHDLAEAITGDLTPYEPAGGSGHSLEFLNQRHLPNDARKAAKRAAEAAAIETMTAELPSSMRDEIAVLWRELEERSTPEARFVKQVDKLETYLQSLDYAAEHPGLPVDSFAAEVADVIDLPSLAALRDAAKDRDPIESGD